MLLLLGQIATSSAEDIRSLTPLMCSQAVRCRAAALDAGRRGSRPHGCSCRAPASITSGRHSGRSAAACRAGLGPCGQHTSCPDGQQRVPTSATSAASTAPSSSCSCSALSLAAEPRHNTSAQSCSCAGAALSLSARECWERIQQRAAQASSHTAAACSRTCLVSGQHGTHPCCCLAGAAGPCLESSAPDGSSCRKPGA